MTDCLDIRTKCVIFLAFMAWTFSFTHPVCHLAVFFIITAIGLLQGIQMRQIISGLLPLAPLFVMILLFTGLMPPENFSHPENRLPLAGGENIFTLTRGGLLLGAAFVLRLVNMVMATRLFMALTPLDAFISLFSWLRLPPALSFMITTALRFIPALDNRRKMIIAAQQARGVDLAHGPWPARFKARMAVMIPLIVSAMSIADQLTCALMNRGFGYTSCPTPMTRLKFSAKDGIITALGLAATLAAVYIRWTTGLWQI